MNQRVPAFPDPPEDIVESPDLKYRADPLNEKNDRHVGDENVVSKDNAKVEVLGQKFSFFRGDNLWKHFHE
jgi:hypothetical protein